MHRVAQQSIFSFQPFSVPERPSELDLRAQNCQQARILPGLLDEIPGAAPHHLHCQFDTSPGGHHHDREPAINELNTG